MATKDLEMFLTETQQDNRPEWPYQMWDIEEDYDISPSTDTEDTTEVHKTQAEEEIVNTSGIDETWIDKDFIDIDKMMEDNENVSSTEDNRNKRQQHEEHIQEDEVIVPDHWADELDTAIPESCPINALLNAIASPDISTTQSANDIKTTITPMVEETLRQLTSRYTVFKDSYLMPVGSMTEQTKIHQADEFDFAVMLPLLADEKYLEVLCNKGEVIPNPSILALIDEFISLGDSKEAFRHFQHFLRELWSLSMTSNVPEGWKILNPSGHSDEHSVAATFHVERMSDNTRVDLDVCFWVPLNKANLLKLPTMYLPQKKYLLSNCFDSKGLIYAVLPQDFNICLVTNSLRFAMSSMEKETLLKYGPENGRLKCYRLSKCIAASLLPKVRKQEECSLCLNSLVSSYCLKNIVLYMVAYYKGDLHWTAEKLPNRIVEVFYILAFCMKVNFCGISAYLTPYQLDIDRYMTYNPESKCVVDKNENIVYDISEDCWEETDAKDKSENRKQSNEIIADGKIESKKHSLTEDKSQEMKESIADNKTEGEKESFAEEKSESRNGSLAGDKSNKIVAHDRKQSIAEDKTEDNKEIIAEDKSEGWKESKQIQCILPNLNSIKQQLDDKTSLKALTDYEQFLTNSEWRYPEVICRLCELLTVLMCTDEKDREEMAEEPGWYCFGLPIPDTN